MTTGKLGLIALCAVLAGFGNAETYKIRDGDTLAKIAHRFHTSERALGAENGLKSSSILRVGHKIHIPSTGHRKKLTASRMSSGYSVRNGDNDWAIAHRNHITLAALHSSNAGVDWNALLPGTRLNISGHGSQSKKSTAVAFKRANRSDKRGTYKVVENDNDWLIASRLGINGSELHHLNPNVNWSRIHPGQRLIVPAGAIVAHARGRIIRTPLAVVSTDGVTLRRHPTTSAEKVTMVPAGTLARVLDRDNGWYKLRFPKGTEAWVKGDYLNAVHRAHLVATRHSRHQYSTRTVATRRRHRFHQSSAVAFRRRHRHSSPGLAVASAEMGGSKLLASAYAMRGTRYVWGASRSSGVDCSGFTSLVYRKNGVKLPRTSREQSSVGAHVSRSALKKGDLVFFKTNRGIRINHVGIYIGNGKFIHASSGGGRVQVNSLSEGYYNRRFAAARRVTHESHAKKKSKH